MFALVAHGAVLDGPGEDDGVAGLALDLDGVIEELSLVLGEGRNEVGVGPDGGATVLLGEICQEGDELDRLGEKHRASGTIHLMHFQGLPRVCACSWHRSRWGRGSHSRDNLGVGSVPSCLEKSHVV